MFSTPENLLVGISGAQGMKERHFLSKNMFSENAVEYLRTLWMLELSNLCYCVQHPWKLTSRDFWISRNERKALSQQKCVLRSNWRLRSAYFERYCRNWLSFTELNEHVLIYLFRNPRNGHWNLQNCHHCVQHPWKLTSRDFWSSRNERKPLSKQKCVFEKML